MTAAPPPPYVLCVLCELSVSVRYYFVPQLSACSLSFLKRRGFAQPEPSAGSPLGTALGAADGFGAGVSPGVGFGVGVIPADGSLRNPP